VAGGGEAGHVHPDLGDDFLGAGDADAGDFIELGDLVRERGDCLAGPGGELLNLGGESIDAVQHHGPQVAVVVAEMPGERLGQDAHLAAHAATGQLRERAGVTLPGDQRFQHRPARHPEDMEY
jgi:hypothetical protein